MSKAEMIPHEAVLADALSHDPDLAREWERLTVARTVAERVIEFRATYGLTQRELATRLDVSQPLVARLESGMHDPSTATLLRLSGVLGLRFDITIAPDGDAESGRGGGAAPNGRARVIASAG